MVDKIYFHDFYQNVWHGPVQPTDRREKNWLVDRSSAKAYTDTFSPLLHIPTFVDLRTQELGGNRPLTLDIMADTTALFGFQLPGVALRLKDIRSERDKIDDDDNGRFLITGDVRNSDTWTRLQRIRKEKWPEKSGFDFIMCRGIAGMDCLTTNPNVHFYLLQEAYWLLSTGGVIITQIPESSKYLANEWVLFINRHYRKSLEAKVARGLNLGHIDESQILGLIKHEGAPLSLPTCFSIRDIEGYDFSESFLNQLDRHVPGLFKKNE